MRGSRVLVLLAVLALVSVVMLVVVGGGNAKPQRALGAGKTHYQFYPVADLNTSTQLYPAQGSAPASKALAITSLTIDNPSSSPVIVGIHEEFACNGAGLVLSRVMIPPHDTVHLEYSAEPLIAQADISRGRTPGWCLTIEPDGTGENVLATIVGYTFKP